VCLEGLSGGQVSTVLRRAQGWIIQPNTRDDTYGHKRLEAARAYTEEQRTLVAIPTLSRLGPRRDG